MKENIQHNSNLNRQSQNTKIAGSHPSDESQPKLIKPSIKVGYNVISNKQTSDVPQSCKRHVHLKSESTKRAPSQVKMFQNSKAQYASGRFEESEYCPNQVQATHRSNLTKVSSCSHTNKANVSRARQRYQVSESVGRRLQGSHQQRIRPSAFQLTSCKNSSFQSSKTSRLPDSQKSQTSKIPTNRLIASKSQFQSDRSRSQRSLPSYKDEGVKGIIEYEHAGTYREKAITPKCNEIQKESTKTRLRDKYRAFNQIHDFDFRKITNRNIGNQVMDINAQRIIRGLR